MKISLDSKIWSGQLVMRRN
uniref:Uncharacterized protein n=1 Tax=Arundo donax TaxID=35708 RepID=A0A0A8YH72_ARUDO